MTIKLTRKPPTSTDVARLVEATTKSTLAIEKLLAARSPKDFARELANRIVDRLMEGV
jgi:hypothetical protein